MGEGPRVYYQLGGTYGRVRPRIQAKNSFGYGIRIVVSPISKLFPVPDPFFSFDLSTLLGNPPLLLFFHGSQFAMTPRHCLLPAVFFQDGSMGLTLWPRDTNFLDFFFFSFFVYFFF